MPRSDLSRRPARPRGPELQVFPRRERGSGESGDILTRAPCPVCGHALIARQGVRGPYFYCLCTAKKRAA